MTVTPDNIKWGACNIVYDGVDLGATAGDVAVTITRSVAEAFIDAYGPDAPVKAWEKGIGISVSIPLAEMALEQLVKTIIGSAVVTDALDPTKKKLTVGRVVGTEEEGAELVLHPLHREGADLSDDLTVYRAFIPDPGSLTLSPANPKLRTVVFKGMPDTTRTDGDQLYCIGDPNATA